MSEKVIFMQAAPKACYRYRTAVLVGPWRRSADQALQDAVAAGQAKLDHAGPRWQVNGMVEESFCHLDKASCGGVSPPFGERRDQTPPVDN
jgi:hypothetical protein